MKSHPLTRYGLMAAIILAAVFGIAYTRSRGQDTSPPPKVSAEAVTRAVRAGGIRAAAKLKGRYVVSESVRAEGVYDGLEALASHSDVIIVGTASENVCRLSADGRNITTDYTVTADRVMKGDVKKGDSLFVSTPGGLMVFEDGTSAEVRVPDFRKMENGKTYVLFLSEQNNSPGAFRIVGGPQGLFELSTDGTVKPHGRSIDIVKTRYKDKEQKAFIKEVKDAAGKWPGKRKCCD